MKSIYQEAAAKQLTKTYQKYENVYRDLETNSDCLGN